MKILEFTSKEAAAPLMSVAAPQAVVFEILRKKFKILIILIFFGKFRIIISKVRDKL